MSCLLFSSVFRISFSKCISHHHVPATYLEVNSHISLLGNYIKPLCQSFKEIQITYSLSSLTRLLALRKRASGRRTPGRPAQRRSPTLPGGHFQVLKTPPLSVSPLKSGGALSLALQKEEASGLSMAESFRSSLHGWNLTLDDATGTKKWGKDPASDLPLRLKTRRGSPPPSPPCALPRPSRASGGPSVLDQVNVNRRAVAQSPPLLPHLRLL